MTDLARTAGDGPPDDPLTRPHDDASYDEVFRRSPVGQDERRRRVDQAWALEQSFWAEVSAGKGTTFYARHMAADGFVVLPNRVVGRNELVSRWPELEPVTSYDLSEPTFTLLEGGNVVITYHVTMDASWLPDYAAYMTALYSWQAGAWALIFRAHTPSGNFPF